MVAKAKIQLTAEDQTRGAFASITRNFDRLKAQAGSLSGTLGGLAVAGQVAAVFERLHHSIELLDKLDDLQEKTGVSVEKLSELRYAGETTGTSFEQLQGGLNKLAKTMTEAAGGNKEAAATFDALGVEVTDSNGKLRATEDVLAEVATKFSGFEDGPAKAALAMRLFGRSGAEMIPLLNLGAAGLARNAEEARRLGAIYDKETAKAAADLNDNLAKLKLSSEGAAVAIAGPLVKALADFTGRAVDAKKEGDKFAQFLVGLEGLGNVAAYTSIPGQASLLMKFIKDSGTETAKSTKDIQAYVNALGGLNAGGGRGFVNPKVAAPVVPEPEKKEKKTDPLAEAKRYLEHLQKQLEKMQELTAVEQALKDIQMKRLGATTPELEKQIVAAARLVDLKQAEENNEKASKKAAEDAVKVATKHFEEFERYADSVATPFEKLQKQLKEISAAAEENGLLNGELVERLNAKAYNDYFDALDIRMEQTIDHSREMADAITGGLERAVIDGDKFSDVLRSIEKDILRIIFRTQVSAPFSDWLTGALGGGSSKPGGSLDPMGNPIGDGGGAGGGLLSSFGDWFGKLLSFDVGTSYVPHDMVAKIHKGEAIIPAAMNKPSGFGARASPQIHINVQGQVDRRTSQQIGRDVSEALRRSETRNG